MNLKKLFALMLALLLLAALFSGCAKDAEKPTESAEPQSTEADATEPAETEAQSGDLGEVFATVNDVKVVIGTPYADVKDSLGEETRPADVEGSCDPGSDWCRTYHHYKGIDVVEDQNGNVANLEMQEADDSVAFMGQIKLGDPIESAYAVLGEPEPNEYGIFYTTETVHIALYPSESGDTISGIIVMAN